jgi:hypothetical protein
MFKGLAAAVGQISNAIGFYGWLSGGGSVSAMGTAYWFWDQYPRVATALLTIGLLASALFIYAVLFVPKVNTCWPPWWAWFYNPMRKVSWNFGCVLQVHDLPANAVPVIGEFSCSLRVNRGSIQPKNLYLESAIKPQILMKVQCGPTHEFVTNIETIPSGQWHHCSARLLKDFNYSDDGLKNHPTREDFLKTYDELTLVFEYDDKTFRKRFSRKQLVQIIDFGIAFYTKPPARLPRLKTSA